MPLPETIDGQTDACSLARRWLLDPDFAQALVDLVRRTHEKFAAEGLRWPDVRIISGYRDRETAASVGSDYETSCHSTCPAVAADLALGTIDWPPGSVVPGEWGAFAIMGGIWKLMGGRWGGDFSYEGGGVPGGVLTEAPHNIQEHNHFDWGPCAGIPRP